MKCRIFPNQTSAQAFCNAQDSRFGYPNAVTKTDHYTVPEQCDDLSFAVQLDDEYNNSPSFPPGEKNQATDMNRQILFASKWINSIPGQSLQAQQAKA